MIVCTSRGQMALKGFAGTQETFHVRADGGRVVEQTPCEDVAGSDDARSKVFNVDVCTDFESTFANHAVVLLLAHIVVWNGLLR